MQKNRKKVLASQNKSHLFSHIAACISVGIGTAFILFSGFALIMCKTDIPPQFLVPVSTILISISMIPAGLILSLLQGEKGMLCGLLTGIGFFAILWITALINQQMEFTALAAIKGMSMIIAGTIGGFLGIMLKEHRRKIR